jgi:hypothetical protein
MTKNEALKMAYDWLTCVSTNNEDEVTQACKEALETPECNTHPDAPHGFCRDASHSADRYVCECEFWKQPAQEPVAWMNVKDKLPPQEINFLSFSETFGYQVSMYSSNPLNSTGLPTLERLKITKWMPIPLYTHPAPSWQGLSDDENGLIVHDDIPHGDITFDEESRPQ